HKSIGVVAKRGFDSLEIGRLAADCAEFLGMYATRDQETVEAGRGRTGNVGAQAVADGENPGAVVYPEEAKTGLVDRRKRLAMPPHTAARLLVPLCQCASAKSEPTAVHHDEIGVGANHREIAVQCRAQQQFIVVNAVLPSGRSSVENELRLLDRIDEFES